MTGLGLSRWRFDCQHNLLRRTWIRCVQASDIRRPSDKRQPRHAGQPVPRVCRMGKSCRSCQTWQQPLQHVAVRRRPAKTMRLSRAAMRSTYTCAYYLKVPCIDMCFLGQSSVGALYRALVPACGLAAAGEPHPLRPADARRRLPTHAWPPSRVGLPLIPEPEPWHPSQTMCSAA